MFPLCDLGGEVLCLLLRIILAAEVVLQRKGHQADFEKREKKVQSGFLRKYGMTTMQNLKIPLLKLIPQIRHLVQFSSLVMYDSL